jgi:16S rRNA (guanine527-N7)-methyltransferase
LGLDNLTVVHNRVENFTAELKFEAIISRAFSDLALFTKLTAHLLAENGRWLSMKGLVPTEELAELTMKPAQTIALKVAGLEAQRHLLVFDARV